MLCSNTDTFSCYTWNRIHVVFKYWHVQNNKHQKFTTKQCEFHKDITNNSHCFVVLFGTRKTDNIHKHTNMSIGTADNVVTHKMKFMLCSNTDTFRTTNHKFHKYTSNSHRFVILFLTVIFDFYVPWKWFSFNQNFYLEGVCTRKCFSNWNKTITQCKTKLRQSVKPW